MDIVELPVEDEWPHAPGPDPLWQESVVLAWQDVDQSIGGFFRIGHHPNRGLGICTFGIVSSEGACFNGSRSDIAMRAGDRSKSAFAIDGFVTAEFETGRSRWSAHDDHCDVELSVVDVHPLYDVWALSGLRNTFREKFAASHTEVAAMVSGKVRLGPRSWDVQGFAFRDHSWGIRDHNNESAELTNFCWLVGSFGKDLVIGVSEVVSRNGTRFGTGFVIKDGEIDRPVLQDAVFHVNLDGISTRGGNFRIATEKFGVYDLEVSGFGNVLMAMQSDGRQGNAYLEVGMPGVMRCNGRIGGAHLSTMFNARGATNPPVLLFGASDQKGLYIAPTWTPSRALGSDT